MLEMNQAVLTAVQKVTGMLKVVGVTPMFVMIHDEVSIQVKFEKDYYAAVREEKVSEFLESFPGLTVERRKETYSSGAPNMVVKLNYQDTPVEINFGAGTCEKKQVGTRTRLGYDPEALKNIPMVEVEEPVYEYLCNDPLASLA